MSIKARAFSPAGISSFFEICNRGPNGALITNPEHIGARGGGFVISKGVFTEVSVAESEKKSVKVFINEEPAPYAETTKTVVNMLLEKVDGTYEVTVRHRVEVPISAGFGSSGAGALGTALALGEALDASLTYNEIGRIAHIAEVRCGTGLGTVGPLMLGGCILTVEPGAPGHALIDRIPVSPDHRIVAGVFQPLSTKKFLESPDRREEVNIWGQKTVDLILSNPSLENFMRASKEFAMRTGLISGRVQKLITLAEKAGAIGAAQNMVGEAVHALVTLDKLESVTKSFERSLPREKIITAEIDLLGARLLG